MGNNPPQQNIKTNQRSSQKLPSSLTSSLQLSKITKCYRVLYVEPNSIIYQKYMKLSNLQKLNIMTDYIVNNDPREVIKKQFSKVKQQYQSKLNSITKQQQNQISLQVKFQVYSILDGNFRIVSLDIPLHININIDQIKSNNKQKQINQMKQNNIQNKKQLILPNIGIIFKQSAILLDCILRISKIFKNSPLILYDIKINDYLVGVVQFQFGSIKQFIQKLKDYIQSNKNNKQKQYINICVCDLNGNSKMVKLKINNLIQWKNKYNVGYLGCQLAQGWLNKYQIKKNINKNRRNTQPILSKNNNNLNKQSNNIKNNKLSNTQLIKQSNTQFIKQSNTQLIKQSNTQLIKQQIKQSTVASIKSIQQAKQIKQIKQVQIDQNQTDNNSQSINKKNSKIIPPPPKKRVSKQQQKIVKQQQKFNKQLQIKRQRKINNQSQHQKTKQQIPKQIKQQILKQIRQQIQIKPIVHNHGKQQQCQSTSSVSSVTSSQIQQKCSILNSNYIYSQSFINKNKNKQNNNKSSQIIQILYKGILKNQVIDDASTICKCIQYSKHCEKCFIQKQGNYCFFNKKINKIIIIQKNMLFPQQI